MPGKNYIGAIHAEPEAGRPVQVIETDVFQDEARRFLTDEDIEEIKYCVASMREIGDVIPGTGGLRKFRWGLDIGKRKGARILYYYGNDDMPIVLVDIYKKSEKVDIAAADKKIIRKLIKTLVDEYRNKNK